MFKTLLNNIREGIKHDISSRREKIRITPKLFGEYSTKYFNSITDNQNNTVTIEDIDKKNILFLLRNYFCLWVEIDGNRFSIHSEFPKSFMVIKDIPNLDDDLRKKGFQKGGILYHVYNSYNTCNRLRGVPLWYEMNTNNKEITPSFQVNYEFIQPIY